jgi:hypothetical protein
MPYRETKLGLLIRLDPKAAKKEILEAFKANDLVTPKAAEALDVSVSGLKGYVVKLELNEQIDKLREKSKAKNFPSYDRAKSSKLQTKLAKERAAEAATEAEPPKKTPRRTRRSGKSKKANASA